MFALNSRGDAAPWFCTLLMGTLPASAADLGTAFTYQGVLENPPGSALTDVCAFEFFLCDDALASCAPGTVSTHPAIDVVGGVFTVPDVDFGPGAFIGQARWMEIRVQCSGDASFVTLSPRVELTPAPQALALPGLYTQPNASSPNLIGGFSGNSTAGGIVGATISGGGGDDALNVAEESWTVIGGGAQNIARGFYAVVGGGAGHTAAGQGSTISGGETNAAEGPWSTVGGGSLNTAAGESATIGGGYENRANGDFAIVSGGQANAVDALLGTIGGGFMNHLTGPSATISGGASNTTTGASSVIGGGSDNSITAGGATIAGGALNSAGGEWAAIAGGNNNTCDGESGSIAGGAQNRVNAAFAMVPGGQMNRAGGTYSLAAGRRASVRDAAQSGDANGDEGTFVWADATDTDFPSTGPNQFLIRASGGIGIGTNAPTAQLDVKGGIKANTVEILGGSPLDQPLSGWGANDFGQIDVPPGAFNAVAAGYYHSVAIRGDGTLIAWGNNDFGQTNVPPGMYSAVSAAGFFNLALRTDGTLAGWGDNSFGQINVPSGAFNAVSAGYSHGLAIRTDGSLLGWGDNTFGQINVPAGTFNAVVAGYQHSLAIRSDGTLVGWGRNVFGETDVPDGTFTMVSAGPYFSLAIRSDGTLAGWGDDTHGQLAVPPGTFTSVSAGGPPSGFCCRFGLAIRTDGTLAGWGGNNFGQINVPAGTFTAVTAGAYHSLAIHRDAMIDPALRLHADSAFKPGSNTWTIYSDRRLKKDITSIPGALDRLLQLRGVSFRWIDPGSQGGRAETQMGLIADEVQKVFPQWVGRDPRGYQTLTVAGFEALTAEAVRELRDENNCQLAEFQEREIAREQRIRDLENRLAAIESLLRVSNRSGKEGRP